MQQGFRHEYKYLISQEAAELLKRRLPGMLARDPHAGASGQYTIRSLYFDNPEFAAYTEKLDGVRDREKFRLRCYNYDTAFVRLEKKEKIGNLTRKTAQTVSEKLARSLQNGKWPASAEGALLSELRMKMLGGLKAAVLVDYDRTPFVCNAGQTRITLDENIRTRPYEPDLWASHTAMMPVLDPGQVVLEVKFNDFLPGYLGLEDIPKVNLAVSKYVLCANLL